MFSAAVLIVREGAQVSTHCCSVYRQSEKYVLTCCVQMASKTRTEEKADGGAVQRGLHHLSAVAHLQG
jgi:hypothetical protein